MPADGSYVIAVWHNLAANTCHFRVVRSDGTIVTSTDTAATMVDRAPDTLVCGGIVNGDNVAQGFYQTLKMQALLALTDTIPSDAELQAYAALTCRDARLVWPTPRTYYVASLVSDDSTIPNLGSNEIPLTLVGPVASDMVAL